MSNDKMSGSDNASTQGGKRRFSPRTGLGWAAIFIALVAIASWVAFPFITMAYRSTYPLVDSWIMPAIATGLVDLAAIVSLAAVLARRERSILSLVTLVVTALAGVGFTITVVGEAIP